LPKAKAEARLLHHSSSNGSTEWKCSQCGATDRFVSELSPEGEAILGAIANDLVFEAYAALLQEAGYDVTLYSLQCDHGDHQACDGKNRAASGVPGIDRCWCACHKK